MNKVIFRALALCAALILMVPAAMAAEAKSNGKIGIVNLQRLLNESDFGKQAKSTIEETFKQKQAVIDGKAKEKDKLVKDLEKQGMALADDERKKRIDEIEGIEREISHMVSDADNYMQKIDRQKKEEFLKSIDNIIDKYGKDEAYMLIVPTDAVIYSEANMEITDAIMTIFNDAFKRKSDKEKSPSGEKESTGSKKKGK